MQANCVIAANVKWCWFMQNERINSESGGFGFQEKKTTFFFVLFPLRVHDPDDRNNVQVQEQAKSHRINSSRVQVTLVGPTCKVRVQVPERIFQFKSSHHHLRASSKITQQAADFIRRIMTVTPWFTFLKKKNKQRNLVNSPMLTPKRHVQNNHINLKTVYNQRIIHTHTKGFEIAFLKCIQWSYLI